MSIIPGLTNKQFIEGLPLCRAMSISVELDGDGRELLRLPYSTELIGDPNTGVIHGGAVSVLLDSCCGMIAFTHPDNAAPTATIDLRIDYMRPAVAGNDLLAHAEVYHFTNSVAFLRGVAWDVDPAKPVAMATGAFTFAKRSER